MTGRGAEIAQRGGAYLLALTALLALTGLGIAISRIASTERRLGRALESRLQALAAAESGLAIAIAGLLEGRPVEHPGIELGPAQPGPVRAIRRIEVELPTLLSIVPCTTCGAEESRVARVSYRLGAIGERLLSATSDPAGRERRVARVALEAVVTLQPWPSPGAIDDDPEDAVPDPRCADDDVVARLTARLTAELNPSRCRFAGRTLPVSALDPESGAVCAIEVPVCVVVSDWREVAPV